MPVLQPFASPTTPRRMVLPVSGGYQASLSHLLHEIDLDYPVRTVDRSLIPTFDFGRCLAVVVIGQDGLVANAARYVGELPIIGVNPDPARYDGVLLPFQVRDARAALQRAIEDRVKTREVTLAEVNTNDDCPLHRFAPTRKPGCPVNPRCSAKGAFCPRMAASRGAGAVEEDLWLCPIEDRRRENSLREGLPVTFIRRRNLGPES